MPPVDPRFIKPLQPMYAREVYRILRVMLAPWFKSEGFKRTRSGMLGWYRPLGERDGTMNHLVIWCQVSMDGWDPYLGSRFTVELQESMETEPGYGRHRVRLGRLLTDAQREGVRDIQNGVIAKLVLPPADYWSHFEPRIGAWYRQMFQPVELPYSRNDDIWFRYHDEEDVRMWGDFMLGVLPLAIARFVDAPEQ